MVLLDMVQFVVEGGEVGSYTLIFGQIQIQALDKLQKITY